MVRKHKVIKTIPNKKEDFKNLSGFLQKHGLLDAREIWFGGFNDVQAATHNAVAANLFYGNKRLILISVCSDDIYYLRNSKEGFQVMLFGTVNQKFHVYTVGIALNPSVRIEQSIPELNLSIKVTKNKGAIKTFKKLVK